MVVANWLVEKVVGVERFKNRVMKVNVSMKIETCFNGCKSGS